MRDIPRAMESSPIRPTGGSTQHAEGCVQKNVAAGVAEKEKIGVYEAFFAIRSVQMSSWWRLRGRNGSF